MSIISLPVPPAQPNLASYSLRDLYLFREPLGTAEYQAMWGEPAPKPDPSWQQKRWRDTSVDLSDPQAYMFYSVARVVNGVWKVMPLILPAWQAAAVNFIPDGAGSVERAQLVTMGDPMAVPIRQLILPPAPNAETIVDSPYGPQVQRADLQLAQVVAAGYFTSADAALLAGIPPTLAALQATLATMQTELAAILAGVLKPAPLG